MRGIAVVVLGVALASGSARGQLAPPRQTVDSGSPRSRDLSSQAGEALARKQPDQALQIAAQAATVDPTNPWAHYNRAAALSDLGHVDDAVAEFRVAQQAFSAQDAWGKSVAIYGRANALARAGRCSEARPVFEEYATYVARADPAAAQQARSYARECVERR
jgi:tetratricopeptide (TPR) repeat protein